MTLFEKFIKKPKEDFYFNIRTFFKIYLNFYDRYNLPKNIEGRIFVTKLIKLNKKNQFFISILL